MEEDKFLKYYVYPLEDAYYSVLADEAVIFVPRRNSFSTLNRQGSRIWELSDGSRTLGQICRIISGECGLPVKTIAGDICAFTRRLAKKGLLFFRVKGRKGPCLKKIR